MPAPWSIIRLASVESSDKLQEKDSTSKTGRHRSSRLPDYLLGDPTPVTALELPPLAFRLAWMLVVSAHVLCAAFLAGCAAAYWYFMDPLTGFYVQLWSPKSGNVGYEVYSWTFGTVGALHGLRVLQLLRRSFRAQHLVFRGGSCRSTGSIDGTVIESFSSKPRKLVRQPTLTNLMKVTQPRILVVRFWRAFFSRRGLFGVENEHFLTVFIIRETLEVGAQTYQAYQSSQLLPRVWLNSIMVALLVANCWSTMAVGRFFGRKPTLERVVALSADAVICILMSVLVPVLIVHRHYGAFNRAGRMFKDPSDVYDPVLITSFVLESQLVFVSSTMDLGAKLTPHIATFLALVTVGALVGRKEEIPVSSTVAVAPSRWGELSLLASRRNITSDNPAPESSSDQHPGTPKRRRAWMHVIAEVLFCLWGAIVLGVHCHTAVHSHFSGSGCRASTRPWLVHHAACSSIVISCQTESTTSPDVTLLEQLDAQALATVAFAHCPKLRMPDLRRFSNLLVLQIYNSTVVEWELTTVSTSTNSRLVLISVARSRFPSGFPRGLTDSIPTSLLSIQFCVTDVAALPRSLTAWWHPMAAVSFDYSEMVEFPASLLSLQVYAISLNGNQLETVPQLAAMPPGQMIGELAMRDNPLRELPPALGYSTNMFIYLDLQGTNLTALPSWTQTQVLGVVYMYNTPYCNNATSKPQQANVQCTPRSTVDNAMDFPLELFDRMYAF